MCRHFGADKNKARLVTQGYTQVEDHDFRETYALVARLEVIMILLAYACAHNIKLYQMDVKSAFLNAFHRSIGNSLCPYRTPAW